MGNGRIKKHAKQDVDRDEDASPAEKCLQKVHVTSDPFMEAHSWQDKRARTLHTIAHV